MIVKRPTRYVYKGGYNHQYYVDEMEDDHILRCLVQVTDQWKLMTVREEAYTKGGVKRITQELESTIRIFVEELDRRV